MTSVLTLGKVELLCTVCGKDCQSLHNVWRGINIDSPSCPTCANNVFMELKKTAHDENSVFF